MAIVCGTSSAWLFRTDADSLHSLRVSNETFAELEKYANLSKCRSDSDSDFVKCRGARAIDVEGIDKDSRKGRESYCCASWRLRQCYLKAVRNICTELQYELIRYSSYYCVFVEYPECENYMNGKQINNKYIIKK